jgi:hypothetical protein
MIKIPSLVSEGYTTTLSSNRGIKAVNEQYSALRTNSLSFHRIRASSLIRTDTICCSDSAPLKTQYKAVRGQKQAP